MNKRILKNTTLCILLIIFICISCIGLSGCYRGPFFDKEHLAKHLVPDLPQPKKFMSSYRGSDIRVKITEAEFNDYVVSVYEYLMSCNFEKFGTRGELYSGFLGMTYYVNEGVSELSDFYVLQEMADESHNFYMYVFVWANEFGQTYGPDNWLPHYLKLYYKYDTGTMFMELCKVLNPYTFENE